MYSHDIIEFIEQRALTSAETLDLVCVQIMLKKKEKKERKKKQKVKGK